ncbi:transglycosylase SLT domain-containing protein [Chondromyces crocatus]|nr:transglycosylase SLT domain-containing protein [Chondromyces crocatus]
MIRLNVRSRTAVMALVATVGIGCAHTHVGPSANAPSAKATELAAGAPMTPAPPPNPIVPGTAGEAPGFDPSQISQVLADPRLSAVQAAVERGAYVEAAKELTAKVTAVPLPPAEELTTWLFQLGRLRALAGDPLGAAKAYQASADAALQGTLAGYARYQAATLLGRAGEAEAALGQAALVPPGLAIERDLETTVAAALAQKGDIEKAATTWRSHLARSPRPPGWIQTTLRFARALLAHPSEAHAEEAARLARRVLDEAPGGAGAGEAKEIETQALSSLPFPKRRPLETPGLDALATRAKALAGARRGKEALATADALLKALSAPGSALASGPSEVACAGTDARAQALELLKRKAEASEAYGVAIERCAGQPGAPELLYRAGRAAMRGGNQQEALRRFALLEQDHPRHRLADDARYHGARTAKESGDEAKFAQMILTMADAYPEGDMVADGLFELALMHMERAEWAPAMIPLRKALERFPRERAYHAAGRLPYYLARTRNELGDRAGAVALYTQVIREYPLTFYMALAHARLSELDANAANEALTEALARDERDVGPSLVPRSTAFAEPAFARAVALSQQGELKLARGELDMLGLSARTAAPELLWASAYLLAASGGSVEAHGILRSAMNGPRPGRVEIGEWLDHYPTGAWRSAWELAFPRPFASAVTTEAQRFGIPEALAHAIMREESAFDPRAASSASAYGLMQLIVPTAKSMAKSLGLPYDAEALKRPEVNIALGCKYLSVLRNQFSDNPLLAIPGYNAGGGAPKRWIAERPDQSFDLWVERIPYEETRLYTKRVITSMAAYEHLYARDQAGEALRIPLPASPTARSAVASAMP